jgi:UDP:flavonoid glycosyltransferase YjiC (YdhE family)
MKFVVAGYGSRGDVEPCVAVGRELLRRGHDVRMTVRPNMLGLIESALGMLTGRTRRRMTGVPSESRMG